MWCTLPAERHCKTCTIPLLFESISIDRNSLDSLRRTQPLVPAWRIRSTSHTLRSCPLPYWFKKSAINSQLMRCANHCDKKEARRTLDISEKFNASKHQTVGSQPATSAVTSSIMRFRRLRVQQLLNNDAMCTCSVLDKSRVGA
jgi:hypothetical protein